MKGLTLELAGYAAASLCALAVDMTLLWTLVQYLSVGYVLAATLSFLAGASVAYTLSVRLAFKEHRLNNRRAEFLSFVALGTLGLAINVAIVAISVKYMGLNYLIAKCVAAGCTFMCNFAVRRQLLFVRPLMSRERLNI
jgi:putative flippase GtrA